MVLTGLIPHATELIFLSPVPANKMELFVHSTTCHGPYIHPRLDSILELCPTFPIGHNLSGPPGLLVGFLLLQYSVLSLLSPYLCFISFLYLDIYVLGDDALMN